MKSVSESNLYRARLVVLSVGLLALIFTAGAYTAPVLESDLLRRLYSPACHQMAERSLTVVGTSAAVCARCTGLYLGGAAGLLLATGLLVGRSHRLRPRWLALAFAPTAVDVLLHLAGLPSLGNLPRLLLALPLGLVAGMFLAVGLADLAGAGEAPTTRPNVIDPERRYAG